MKGVIKFGEDVEGYNIPVLNEREVRASAGILFLALYTSLMFILFQNNFVLLKYTISIFLLDFIIRVFINPKYSPNLIMGRLIVSSQNPEYVGAAQKKFAWILGLTLAIIMFIMMVIMNVESFINGLICLLCLIFLFFESVFGICLGCIFYGWFYKEKAQYCPGEVCDLKAKRNIQKTSLSQVAIVFGFAAVITITVFFFNDYFSTTPDQFGEVINSSLFK